ncbi:Fic family protein [Mediterraneibacter gnavus]|uniref:Fic family protein n=1 Tax=Mediterraneibacter gnavus TaxID=33038 RepID=UPI002E8E3155|nr:Fic family protein [Mediterraneibacter gnavus]
MRDYNITKKEWVLDGATVMYGSASELRATLEYDFSQEKDFSYRGLSMDEIIHHLAVFISRLWQIHIFGEGNTRTTAVFFIKYLRTLGFSATNDIFADHAWYFRNALVRANYTNLQKNIHETTVHIHRLFEKFGFDEVFGRSAVMELLQLKSSGASKLISNLVQSDIIEPVSGHGKGKYKFRK